jgi:hypothetical protein
VGAGVGFLWLEAVGTAGQCVVSQDRQWQLLWVLVGCGASHGVLAIRVWVRVAVVVVG